MSLLIIINSEINQTASDIFYLESRLIDILA